MQTSSQIEWKLRPGLCPCIATTIQNLNKITPISKKSYEIPNYHMTDSLWLQTQKQHAHKKTKTALAKNALQPMTCERIVAQEEDELDLFQILSNP
jgi:hypothetical protein